MSVREVLRSGLFQRRDAESAEARRGGESKQCFFSAHLCGLCISALKEVPEP